MRIGVISDTHGRIDGWEKAVSIFAGVNTILHAGDVLYHPPKLSCSDGYNIPTLADALNSSKASIVIARGNCDAEVYEELLNMPVQSPYAVAEIDGLRIVITHGHRYTEEDMIDLGQSFHADVLVSGHTHIPVLERIDSLVLMNPGSPAIPKFEWNGKLTGSVGLITDDRFSILSIDTGEPIFELDR